MASKSKNKPPTTSCDGHESRRWREGVSTQRDAEIARRGLASFARDVRDDADLALELFEIHGVALDVLTNKVVERAVVRALGVLAVH